MKIAQFLVAYSHLPPEVLDSLLKKNFNMTKTEFADEWQKWKKELRNEKSKENREHRV